MADETKLGSFHIQKMTQPDTHWIWSLSNESDEYVMAKGGYKSAEDAARYVCQLIRCVGGDTENVDVWVERTTRTRWKCNKEK